MTVNKRSVITDETRWHGGRGATKFRYTFDDIAALKGLKKETVRKAAKKGVFNPASLESVCRYLKIRIRRVKG
jgi:hypothetical protein